jgi:hypothetical protein
MSALFDQPAPDHRPTAATSPPATDRRRAGLTVSVFIPTPNQGSS